VIEYGMTIWIVTRCVITCGIISKEVTKSIISLFLRKRKTFTVENEEKVDIIQYKREELPPTQVDIDPSDYRKI
jgi:hypothetical protein